MGKKISFVSSKNRGITLDMLVVKDFFRVNDEKVEFKDVVANENAKNSKCSVSCESLMLDDISRSDTIPAMDIRVNDADVGHEATIGRISDDAVFYLMSRGIPEDDARAMIVSGFADNVSKELPLEYAMEMNNLIKLEMKGSIG